MFRITYKLYGWSRITDLNDVKDLNDIVVGITGNSEEGAKAEAIAGRMNFGDMFIGTDYRIKCYMETNQNGSKERR